METTDIKEKRKIWNKTYYQKNRERLIENAKQNPSEVRVRYCPLCAVE